MINLVWVGLILFGVIFGILNGTMDDVNRAVFEGGTTAVTICISLVSVLVFWLGLMKIAEESGLLKKLAIIFLPFMKILFPRLKENSHAMGYIVANMVANLFGLGNAATPMGLKAMEELKKANQNKDDASDEMITFLTLNTSAISLIPTTVIGIRIAYQSTNPTEIIGVTIMAQVVSLVGALFIDRYYRKKRHKKGEKK
ncbi:MAG: nucleoside recognition domain-containing protein [Bacillaceae bacterium]